MPLPLTPTPLPVDGDYAELINQMEAGTFSGELGLRFTRATAEEVVAELEISERHHQLYGVVHGGVHASIVETMASVGAGIRAFAYNKTVLGLENHTSFLRAARKGRLRAKGTPLSRGQRTQVWEVVIHDESDALVATGRVRMLLLDQEAQVAGAALALSRADVIAAAAKQADGTASAGADPGSAPGSRQGKGETP